MQKKELLYEGKAKKIYLTDSDDRLISEFKDDATAFNGEKKGQITGKGQLNTEISSIFFKLLEDKGVPTHFIEQINETDLLVRRLDIIPVEVVMRNIAAGSLARRLGIKEGKLMDKTILEFYYKDDDLGDPLINKYHIYAENLCDEEQLEQISKLAFGINEILLNFLQKKGIDLVDFKLEFGIGVDGKIYLGDEISPDTCRFWDSETKKKLDKDRFRRDLDQVEGAYHEVLRRLKE
jgi:phosphoribosylaminoimidazole-succinocarboxamide synthase